jgi:hypothetical protein
MKTLKVKKERQKKEKSEALLCTAAVAVTRQLVSETHTVYGRSVTTRMFGK